MLAVCVMFGTITQDLDSCKRIGPCGALLAQQGLHFNRS